MFFGAASRFLGSVLVDTKMEQDLVLSKRTPLPFL